MPRDVLGGGTDGLGDSSPYDRDYGLPGIMVPTGLPGVASARALVANRAHLSLVIPSRAMNIVNLNYVVNAAGADDAVDVGIYSVASNGTDLTRMASTGALTGKLNTTGLKVNPMTVSLAANTTYYCAMAAGILTTGTVVTPSSMHGGVGLMLGSTTGRAHYIQADASYPLPASIPSSSFIIASAHCPVFALREF